MDNTLKTLGIVIVVVIIFNSECAGEKLPEGTPDRTTVCAGTPLRGSCEAGQLIAVKHTQYGSKETCAPDKCCDYDASDCLIDYTDTAQQAACTGREVCSEITIAQADTSSCGSPYPDPGLNKYLTMEYYCIPVSRISSIVSGSVLSQTGNLLYLKNAQYPSPIRAATVNASCSIEAKSCSSQIRVYFLHFELSDGATCTDTQTFKIVDSGFVHTYTCSDNTDYEITEKITSSANYITVVLENPSGISEGKILLGFKATNSTAQLRIDCPAQEQAYCKDCDRLYSPAEGTVELSDNTAYQSVATFSCNTGYSLEGSSTRECQINGTWSGENPSCMIKDCGNLTEPGNGVVRYSSGTTYQSTATFSCDTGYSLVGDPTRICQANKTWSGSYPMCQIIDCGNLTDPVNGAVIYFSGTTYQSTATFICDFGYTLVGNTTITCQANKTWSESNLVCTINDCGNLTNPLNGMVMFSNGTTYQSTATFSCDTGYSLVGASTRTCQANKTWSESNPDCGIDDCGSLEAPVNGTVTYSSGTTYQSTATFSCFTGYSLEGHLTRICLANKTWSDTNPICKIKDCGTLIHPLNGAVTFPSGTTYLSTAIFNCDTGYSLFGTSTRTCQANQTWSHDDPTCEINGCGNLTVPSNGRVAFSSGTTYQSIATFTCELGYTLVGDHTRKCQANSTWSDSAPSCEINNCGNLTNPTNGAVTFPSGTIFQSTAIFSCDTGYSLVGASTRTCQANQTWSHDDPSCTMNDCGSLTDPVNGAVTYSSGTTYESTAAFSCYTGYSLVGDLTRTCQANSTWSNSDPACEINDCGDLASPANGSVTYSSGTTYQSTATYSCDTGYSVVGDPTRTCQANKTWTGSNPACKIIECGTLTPPAHGSNILSQVESNLLATYFCNPGYSLNGTNTRECQSNNSWSGESPFCQIKDCGNLANPTNGSVTFPSGTTYQSTAIFSCDTGYSLVGASTRICQANQTWSHDDPSCTLNDCGSLTDPVNGAVTYSSGTTYGSTATFSCYTGYSLVGDLTRKCQANSTWSNSNPACEINDCGNLADPANGSVTYSNGTVYHSTAIFSCDSGYLVVGDPTRTCQANKTWTGSNPACEINDCGLFDGPQKGTVKFPNGTTYNSLALISCDNGFSLVGSSTRKCLANGSWSTEESICFPDCEAFEGPQNGKVIFPNGTHYNSVAAISCDSGFSLVGSSTRKCLASGSWTIEESTCFPVQTTTTVTPSPTPAIEPTLEPGDPNTIYIIAGTIGGAIVLSAIAAVTVFVKSQAAPVKTMKPKKPSKPPPYIASNVLSLQVIPNIKIYGLHPELRPQHRDFYLSDFENGQKITMYSGNDIDSIPHDTMRKELRENGTLTVDNSVDTSQVHTQSNHTQSNLSLSHFVFYKGPAGIDLDSYQIYKG